jgi:hypothetical protein
VRIGDLDVPIEALNNLPDDVLRKIKRKVRAGHEDVEVDVLEALTRYPQAHGWQKRMWEASQAEKTVRQQAQELIEHGRAMGTDAIGALARMYKVTREQAADAISNQLVAELNRQDQLAKMSPEDRQRMQRMGDLERDSAELKRMQEAEKKRAEEAQQSKLRERYAADFGAALKAGGLAVTPRNVRDVANMVATMIDDGLIKGDATPDDLRWAASELAKENAKDDSERMPTDAAQLIEYLGEDRARAVAREIGKRVQQKVSPPTRSPGAKPKAPTNGERPRTFAEWQRDANAQARRRDRAAGRG